MSPQAQIHLHLPAHMLDHGAARMPVFYGRVVAGLRALGASVDLVHRDIYGLQAGPRGGDVDLVHATAIGRAQALTLGTAYLDRFHYMDPEGIFFESSLARARFRPEQLPLAQAQQFLTQLQDQYVTPRRSRHTQPETVEAFGQGHIALFLQDLSDPVERARHMSASEMVEAVLTHLDGRTLIVKPHPRNKGPESDAILRRLAGRKGVRVSHANLHDILAEAAVSVSISSSVGLEGMLHSVPAIFFGATDLHHAAVTVQQAADWPAALQTALTTDWPFAQFLLWFLRRRNLDARRPFMDRVLERITAVGGDLAALGLPSRLPEGFRA